MSTSRAKDHRYSLVIAMISSVLIRLVALPRRWATRDRLRLLTFLIRTVSPTTSISTSVFGRSPSFFRIWAGIVTCPLVVTHILRPPLSHDITLAIKACR